MDTQLKQDVTNLIKSVLETFTAQYTKAYVLALVRHIKLEAQKQPEPWLLESRPKWEDNYKTGYLVKEGGVRKNWKRRFFVVRPNWTVDYYESEAESQKPKGKKKGTINLCGFRVVEDPNQGILLRLKKLAEKMGMDVSGLPKPKEYPPLTFELYHPRRRCYYIQAANKQEFDDWVAEFKKACWRAYGLTIDEWCHQQAFPVAVRKTRWALGRWGWYSGYGSEEQILSELILDEIEYDIMGRIYSKLSGPWVVRSMLRTQTNKVLDAMVSAAVRPSWTAMAKVVKELRPKIEPKIKELTEPIFKAEVQITEKMKDATMSVIDPLLKEHVAPHLGKIVSILKSPMTEAFDECIRIYGEKIDKWEPKDDLKKSFRDLDWFPRSYWEMRTATDKTDAMYEPLWALHLIFSDIYPWSHIWSAHNTLRNVTDNAVWTWETALLAAAEKGETADAKLAASTKAAVLDKFRHDADEATTQYFSEVLKLIVMPPFEAVLHPAVVKIIEPLAETIPEPLREFIDIRQMFEDLYNGIVDETIATIVNSDEVAPASHSNNTNNNKNDNKEKGKEEASSSSSSSSSSSQSAEDEEEGASKVAVKVDVVEVGEVKIIGGDIPIADVTVTVTETTVTETTPENTTITTTVVETSTSSLISGLLQVQHSKHFLDISGDVHAGAHIILSPESNHRWIFTDDGFIVLASDSNLVLDIEGGGGAGTRVIVWSKKESDNANQKWTLSDGFIVSQANGCVLDVKGGSMEPGAELLVWHKKDTDNENQQFVLQL